MLPVVFDNLICLFFYFEWRGRGVLFGKNQWAKIYLVPEPKWMLKRWWLSWFLKSLLLRYWIVNFSLTSMKSFVNFKNPPSPLLQRLWSYDFYHKKQWQDPSRGIEILCRKPPRTCTFIRIFPKTNEGWTLQKMDQLQSGKPVLKLWCGFRTNPLVRKGVSYRSKQSLHIYFSLRPWQT